MFNYGLRGEGKVETDGLIEMAAPELAMTPASSTGQGARFVPMVMIWVLALANCSGQPPAAPVATFVSTTPGSVLTPVPTSQPQVSPDNSARRPTVGAASLPAPVTTRIYDDAALVDIVTVGSRANGVEVLGGHVEDMAGQGTTLVMSIRSDDVGTKRFYGDVGVVAGAFDSAVDKTPIHIEHLLVWVSRPQGGPDVGVLIRPSDIRALIEGKLNAGFH